MSTIFRDNAIRGIEITPAESPKIPKYVISYGAAIIGVIVATLIRMALSPIVDTAVPFLTYFGVVVLLAWYRGFWPAAFSIPFSVMTGGHFFLAAKGPWLLPMVKSGQLAAVGFVLVSLIVSYLIDFQRRLLGRAKAAERTQSIVAAENARLLKQAEMAAMELKASNEELMRLNRDLELFAYSASHDLQEPLRTIALSAQLIQRGAGKRESAPDYVLQIITAAERMDHLIRDIRSYLSVALEGSSPPPQTDSGRVLVDVLGHLQGTIQDSGAVISNDTLPAVPIHETRLAQLFQNLISNAIKYRGSGIPRIHIAAYHQDGYSVFSVADNGIGIDPKYAVQIFGLFKRLHGQEEYQGSGIGLAICQRIVEQYGGRIWLAESKPGSGATFCFSIRNSSGVSSAKA